MASNPGAIAYKEVKLVGGVPFIDSISIENLPYDISTQTDAVSGVIAASLPSSQQGGVAITARVNYSFQSGSRVEGETSVWTAVFPSTETAKILNEAGALRFKSAWIQISVKDTSEVVRGIFETAESIRVSALITPAA